MTNVQNIQRPKLFENFFHLLITWSNEVIDYVKTTNQEKKTDVTPSRTHTTYIKHFIRNIITIAKKFIRLSNE